MKSLNVNEMRSLEGGEKRGNLNGIVSKLSEIAGRQVNLVSRVTDQNFSLVRGQFVMFSEILEFYDNGTEDGYGLKNSNYRSFDAMKVCQQVGKIARSLSALDFIINGPDVK